MHTYIHSFIHSLIHTYVFIVFWAPYAGDTTVNEKRCSHYPHRAYIVEKLNSNQIIDYLGTKKETHRILTEYKKQIQLVKKMRDNAQGVTFELMCALRRMNKGLAGCPSILANSTGRGDERACERAHVGLRE